MKTGKCPNNLRYSIHVFENYSSIEFEYGPYAIFNIQSLSKKKNYTMKYIDIDIVRKLFFVNIRFHEGKVRNWHV